MSGLRRPRLAPSAPDMVASAGKWIVESQPGTSSPKTSPEVLSEASAHTLNLPAEILPRLSTEGETELKREGKMLSDLSVDTAQGLLRCYFPEVYGLYAAAGAFTLPPLPLDHQGPFIQVLNTSCPLTVSSMSDYECVAGTHWITVSNRFSAHSSQVKVYDSLNTRLTWSTKNFINETLANYDKPIQIIYANVQQ